MSRCEVKTILQLPMDVRVPHDRGPGVRAVIVARERADAEDLQRSGTWPHL